MRRVVLALGLAACGGPVSQSPVAAPAPPAPPVFHDDAPPPPAAAEPAPPDDLGFCVAETNRYRATLGKPPLARAAALEAFAAEGARVDGEIRRPHHHFASATFPGTYSGMAENELPWWPL